MWRLTKAQLKAGRWAEEEEKADSRVEARGLSGARIVCQSPSIPLTMQPHKQTPADTVTRRTKKKKRTHVRACHSDPLSPHFETLKIRLSNGGPRLTAFLSPPQPSRRIQRDRRA